MGLIRYRAPMLTPRERTIQRACLKTLRAAGAYAVNIAGGPAIDTGTPDILACYRGRFVAVEVKRPGQVPTEIQRFRLKQIAGAGGHCIVAINKADVIAGLAEIDEEIARWRLV